MTSELKSVVIESAMSVEIFSSRVKNSTRLYASE